MDTVQLASLGQQVLWAAFALSVLFGAITHRTDFCTMGAVSDVVNMGDWTRMRMWVLAIGVAVLGFNAMVAAGWVQAGQTVYAGTKLIWLSNLLGGLLFGFFLPGDSLLFTAGILPSLLIGFVDALYVILYAHVKRVPLTAKARWSAIWASTKEASWSISTIVVRATAAQAPLWNTAAMKRKELLPISSIAVPISTVPGQCNSPRKSISSRATTEVAPSTCSPFSLS